MASSTMSSGSTAGGNSCGSKYEGFGSDSVKFEGFGSENFDQVPKSEWDKKYNDDPTSASYIRKTGSGYDPFVGVAKNSLKTPEKSVPAAERRAKEEEKAAYSQIFHWVIAFLLRGCTILGILLYID